MICILFGGLICNCTNDNSTGGPGLETTNTITAKVIASNGAPLSGAKISIFDQFYQLIEQGYTDSLGEYKVSFPEGFVWILANYEKSYRQKRILLNGLDSNILLLTRDVVRLTGKAPSAINSVSIPGRTNAIIPDSNGVFVMENVPAGDVDLCYNTTDTTYLLSLVLYGSGDLYVRQPSKWPAARYEWSGDSKVTLWSEPFAKGEDTTWERSLDFQGVDYLGWYNNKNYKLLNEDGDRFLLLDDFSITGQALLESWTSALWFPLQDEYNSISTIEIGANKLRFDGRFSGSNSLSFAGFGYFFAMDAYQKPVNLRRLKEFNFSMRGTGVVQTQWATVLTQNDPQGDWRRFYSTHLLTENWQKFSVQVDTLKRLENASGQWSDAYDSVMYLQWIWLANAQNMSNEIYWSEMKDFSFYGVNLSDFLFPRSY